MTAEAVGGARARRGGYRRVVRALRKGAQPGPEGFTWRGIAFAQADASLAATQVFASEPIEVGDRTAGWRVEATPGGWHARLRIGHDRFPGVGKTPAEALDAAEAEASHVVTYIIAMLPAGVQTGKRPSSRGKRGAR